jgi:hypothetical protein
MVLITSCLFAQRYTIKGKLIDLQSKENLMFANCILHYKTDTIGIYKGASSDTAGLFVFKGVKKHNLILNISFVGYKTFRKEIKENDFQTDKVIDLGVIPLEKDADLKEVNIVAQKKKIEVDEDKLTMNVDEGLAATSTNAFELLKKVPGVMIDKDDNIKLNGKSGVMFQYNGRELKIGWSAIVDLLKSISPEQVDKFEVMTNPGVKYDAEGTAGIINLKLKKNDNYGINGSVNLRASYQKMWGYGGGARLNYVDDKWVTSFGYSLNTWKSKWEDSTQRYTSRGDDTILFRSNNSNHWKSLSHNFDFSTSYTIDTTSTIGFNANYSFSDNPTIDNSYPTFISHYPNYFSVDSSYENISSSKNNHHDFSMGLSYVKKLDTLDSKISSDLDYSYNDSKNNSLSGVDYYLGDIYNSLTREERYNRESKNNTNNVSWRVDYVKPFNKQMKLEAGFKTNFNFSDKNYSSLKLDTTTNTYLNDVDESNHFKYFENINSLYASFSNKFGEKFSARIGIRAEQTNTRGHQFAIDSINTRSYFDVFPNIRLTYKFKEDNQLSLTYSYRISRPWSSSLDPFMKKNSDYSFSTGNPYLNPQYSHSVSLSHSWKYMLFTSVSYSYTKDDINWLEAPLDSNNVHYNPLALISYPINFGSSQNVNFNLSFNKELFSWWNVYVDCGASYDKINSSTIKQEINRENWGYNVMVNTDFTLPYKIHASGFYMYYSSNISGTSKDNGWEWFNASLSKSFFKDKLNCSFSLGGQLFKSKRYDESTYLNTISKSWNKDMGMRYSFSIRYKFGKFYQNKQVQKIQTEDFNDRAGGQTSGGSNQGGGK